MSMSVGEKIKFLRKQKNLTQGELAKELGVSKSTVAMYEIGRNFPNVEMLHKLCRTLNTTGDYLIGLTDEPNKKFIPQSVDLSADAAHLIDNYNKLNTSGKEKASDYVEDLTTIDKYTAADEPKSKLG